MLRHSIFHLISTLAAVAVLATGCAPGSTPAGDSARPSPRREKTIVVGITFSPDVMPPVGTSSTSGGWVSLSEVYAQGLVTSDRDIARPAPRLASQVPSFESGTIEVLPDGRLKTVYPLRRDVTWHDGAPFTARDMLFTYEVLTTAPGLNNEALRYTESVEAPDEHTLVVYWRVPYYEANALWLRQFWPMPRHKLEESFRTLDPLAFMNLSYWSSPEYVHLGAFRLAEFRPGEEYVFAASDRYFLGRPAVDRIIARVFNDDNVLYAAVLADEVDLLMDNSLKRELTLQLGEMWEQTGAGKVYFGYGPMRFAVPNLNPEFQIEQAFYDPRVRQALMYALDRIALTDTVHRGRRELVANSLVPLGHPHHEVVKDGYARYSFDLGRARALLAQAGWTPGSDGVLVNAEGRRFTTTPLWTSPGNEVEIGAIADYWKQAGIPTEQRVSSLAQRRDQRFLSSFPLETTAGGSWDGVLRRVESSEWAVPPVYGGSNRSHYRSPRVDDLIDRYRGACSHPSRRER